MLYNCTLISEFEIGFMFWSFKSMFTILVVGFGGSIFKKITGNNNPLANENFFNKIIKIYPNPIIDKIILSVDEKISKTYTIDIINIIGKIIFSKSYVNDNEITINTQNFSKGIYFLTVTSGEIKQTEKLIIN